VSVRKLARIIEKETINSTNIFCEKPLKNHTNTGGSVFHSI